MLLYKGVFIASFSEKKVKFLFKLSKMKFSFYARQCLKLCRSSNARCLFEENVAVRGNVHYDPLKPKLIGMKRESLSNNIMFLILRYSFYGLENIYIFNSDS